MFVTVAVLALAAGAAAVGTTLPDPKSSDAYAALAGEKSAVEGERDSAKSSYDSLKSKYDTLQNGIAAREAKVTSREAEVGKADAAVTKREDAVTGAEKTKAANTVGDGTWTVGKDIEAGTYRAAADVGSTCYWGIYATGSNGSNVIENDIPGGGRPLLRWPAGRTSSRPAAASGKSSSSPAHSHHPHTLRKAPPA